MSKPSLIIIVCLGAAGLTALILYGLSLNSKSALSLSGIATANQAITTQAGETQRLSSSAEQITNSNIGTSTNIVTANKEMLAASSSVSVTSGLNTNTMPKQKNIVAVINTSKALPIISPVALMGRAEIMAWIYPGGQSCAAKTEIADGRKIDVLKAEYFTINEAGQLTPLVEGKGSCNGYSSANIASLKKYSKEQYATVSSSYAGSMDLFLSSTLEDGTSINTLVDFAVNNNISGIEIDFEDFGGWTKPMYANYKQFITKLGNALHEKKKKLIIDGPATSSAVEEAWYVWRYADFNALPVDRLVVMTYDYQYDQGSGEPVAPISWLQNTIKWTLGRFPNKAKLSIGIPSYGYRGTIGTQKFSLLAYDQIKKEPGFATAQRDPKSFEMTWQNGNNVYFYQDGESMARKMQVIQSSGINSVSVWHLGGNLWFK